MSLTTVTPSGYATFTISDASTINAPDISTSSSQLPIASTTSSGFVTISTPATQTSLQTSTSSNSANPTTSSFVFLQIDGDALISYNSRNVNDASFTELCPGGNCYESCSDYSLLLDKDSYTFDGNEHSTTNISAAASGITLFSLCSNIGNVTHAISAGDLPSAVPFFPEVKAHDLARAITLDTAICLLDTCQATRDPAQCKDECDPGSLMVSDSALDIGQIRKCLYRLCSNTCGLPNANQDVFGIGVLISYIMQALLVLICAIGVLFYLLLSLIRRPLEDLKVSSRWLDALSTFLTAECYFGMSLVIASFFMGPANINPLDGYALLSVSITAFMPPVFTLMFLHNLGKKSWWSTILVSVNWLLASILFFLLLQNLSTVSNSTARLAEARNSLFKVDSCGGYSSMSLCQENIHNEPLRYLTAFYNKDSLPNIRTVILLWIWSTIVLAILQIRQLVPSPATSLMRHRGNHTTGKHSPFTTHAISTLKVFETAIFKLLVFTLASLIFGLAFGYQAQMVIRYFQSDVIDPHNWSFGQSIAVLFWIPPLVDFLRRLLERDRLVTKTVLSVPPSPNLPAKGSTMAAQVRRKPVAVAARYQPLASSPLRTHDRFTMPVIDPVRQSS